MEWTHEGRTVTEVPEGMVGFVYRIEYENGYFYIGKKLVRSLRKKKPLIGMRKNARRMVMTNHKWRDYEGSSKDTEGHVVVKKEIITWCSTKRIMTYCEVEEQFRHDVLRDPKSLNGNILGTMYRKTFTEGVENE